MTSHKLQHKLSQLFYRHQCVLYNISKVLKVIRVVKSIGICDDIFPIATHVKATQSG